MIISSLITPLAIASNPQRVDFEENYVQPSSYNHTTQKTEYSYGDVAGKPNTMSFTFSGTRTFDYSGKPNDNDNDSD